MDCNRGFDRGLPIQRIVRLTRVEDRKFVMIRWRGLKYDEGVPLSIVREKAPQELIEYLADHLVWDNEDQPRDSRNAMLVTSSTSGETSQACPAMNNDSSNSRGFDMGADAKAVVGATKLKRNLMLLIQWEDDVRSLIPAKQAFVRCPQLVLDFLLDKVRFR